MKYPQYILYMYMLYIYIYVLYIKYVIYNMLYMKYVIYIYVCVRLFLNVNIKLLTEVFNVYIYIYDAAI